MKKVFFTICSNNYLAQATVLGRSVARHEPDSDFFVFLVDEKSAAVDYSSFPFEVITARSIEPRFDELAAKYNIIELNTCIKPRVFEYLIADRGGARLVYLDPDIKVYSPLRELDDLLVTHNVVLTPHILTPIPRDGKLPEENAFLRFGIYNLGFIAIRRSPETDRFLSWWKERTFSAGYNRTDSGQFVDQLYLNLAPIFFTGVAVLRHWGYNMAPWNLHERRLSEQGGQFMVNDSWPLAFYHFSWFRVDTAELPLGSYNRFPMSERADLTRLYEDYNADMKGSGHGSYSTIRWAYTPPPRGAFEQRFRTLARVCLTWGLQKVPGNITERAYQTLGSLRLSTAPKKQTTKADSQQN